MRRTVSTLLLLLFVVIAEAQNLTGKVIDSKTQEAIIGATVTLKGSKKIATVTDINGQFRLSNTTEGSIIRISYVWDTSLWMCHFIMVPLIACARMLLLLARWW